MTLALEMACKNCKVSSYCPKSGSSPLLFKGSTIYCRIVGGYGRKSVDQRILSEKSKELFNKNGPCLTVAEVPTLDVDSGIIKFDVVKVFSPAIKHKRETVPFQMDMMYPSGYNAKS